MGLSEGYGRLTVQSNKYSVMRFKIGAHSRAQSEFFSRSVMNDFLVRQHSTRVQGASVAYILMCVFFSSKMNNTRFHSGIRLVYWQISSYDAFKTTYKSWKVTKRKWKSQLLLLYKWIVCFFVSEMDHYLFFFCPNFTIMNRGDLTYSIITGEVWRRELSNWQAVKCH